MFVGGLLVRWVEARDLSVEVALLLKIGWSAGCGLIAGERTLRIAGHFEQVGSYGVKAPVVVDSRVVVECCEKPNPVLGSPAMATATAWLSTTGPESICRRTVYRATNCGQSLASAVGSSSWMAAIAACSW